MTLVHMVAKRLSADFRIEEARLSRGLTSRRCLAVQLADLMGRLALGIFADLLRLLMLLLCGSHFGFCQERRT